MSSLPVSVSHHNQLMKKERKRKNSRLCCTDHGVKESSRAGEVARQGAHLALIRHGRPRLLGSLYSACHPYPASLGDGPRPARLPYKVVVRRSPQPLGPSELDRQYPEKEGFFIF